MSLAALERRLALAARGLRPGATGTAPPSALALAEALGLDLDPWQRDVLASEATQTAMLCSRQSGKSTVAALLAAWQALAVPGCLVLLLAPSERQAKLLLRSVRRFAAAVPDAARPTNDGRQSLELSNGSEVVALPASEETIRGYAAVALLVVDEAAAVDDALYASMRPTLAVSGGRIVLLSTPRGKRGFFYREWVEGGDDWLRVKVTAADCPRIPADWLARERARIGPWWAAQEYDVEFREAVDQVFGHDVVLAALSDEVAPLFGGAMAEYFIGLDLGQAVDYTALAILERTWRDTGGQRVTRYDVGHLERPPRGTSYPAIVALVQQRATAAAARGTVVAVAVDRTGVGAPVVDLLQRARLPGRIVPITITGGDTVGRDGPGFRVPKRDLVALLGVLLQSERLRVAQALPEAATFVREAVNFRARISAAGHDAYGAGGDGDGWREGPHDDLLLAVALAAWCAEAAPAPNPALGIVAHRLAASPWSRADRRDAPASIVTTNGGPERPSRRRLS